MKDSSIPSGNTFFLDTNILVYAYDSAEPVKQQLARKLLFKNGENCRISIQCIREFVSVATTKFSQPTDYNALSDILSSALEPLLEKTSELELIEEALKVHTRYGYRFYDSMIIAAALTLKCTILYSEDMQDGQKIEGLTIVDPFK